MAATFALSNSGVTDNLHQSLSQPRLRKIGSHFLQIPRHGGEHFLRIDDSLHALIGALKWIFKMELEWAGELTCRDHLKKFREIDHALAERLPVRPPLAVRILLP